MTARMVRVNGVDLCVETFGDPADPAILLIGGAASPMDWWDDELCERIAEGGRLVVRYDLRDTGQSTSFPAGTPGYTGADLVDDAAALIGALELSRAHVAGISMGGGIAQMLALEHPDVVASLTLMSTSAAVPRAPGSPELPPMADRLRNAFANPAPPPDWTDRAAVIERIVADQRPYEGAFPFDEEALRMLAGRIFDRTTDMAASMTNHWLLDDGESSGRRLDEIAVPTLVVHGTEDPLFPLGHGEALASEIPGARLLALEGMGHQVPPRQLWDEFVGALLEHTARAR